jgi:hypothetical protein
MKVDLHTFLDLYGKGLSTLSHLLDKGAKFAAEKGIAEDELLEWRLIDDMFPLRLQAIIAIRSAHQWSARAAGLTVPADLEGPLSLAELQAAITKAKADIAAITPLQLAGRDDLPLTVKLGDIMEPTMPTGQWVSGFATTTFYFHLSTAYGILRSKGVEIGKADMFAGGF